VLSTLVAGFLLGPLPAWRHVPGGADLATQEHIVGAHAGVVERALRLVPPDAPVSATNTLGAHLSERRRVFSFPVLAESEWIVVDGHRPSYRDRNDAPAAFRDALSRIREDGRFEVVFDEDRVLVLRRRAG
jgi:hypothetical protein